MDVLRLLGSRFDHALNRRLPRHRLEEKKLKRFRRLASFARRRSPFYARIMAEAGIDEENCVPGDFPVLTKRQVMDNFDEIVTDRSITRASIEEFLETSNNPLDLFRDRFYVLHTSGSSGEVGFYVYSPADMARGMAQAPRPRLRLRKIRVAFFGATKGHFAGVTFSSTFSRSALGFLFKSETFEINSPLQRVIDGLNDFRPDVLAGYGTGLKILADQKVHGKLAIGPDMLISSGEPLSPLDRKEIEEVFKAPVLNCYMCTEHVYMGMCRPGDKGMYLLEDDLIFECREDHTCVTNLFNFTQPLIRYRMEDVLVPMRNEENCRLPYTKVKEVVGRNEYVPYFTNRHGDEDFISPHIINEFFVRHVKRFQLQVEGGTSFVFKVVVEKGLPAASHHAVLEEIRAKLGKILAEKEMENITFRIIEVDDLPVDKRTGKFKLILPPE